MDAEVLGSERLLVHIARDPRGRAERNEGFSDRGR
jgi:hypothetical protein